VRSVLAFPKSFPGDSNPLLPVVICRYALRYFLTGGRLNTLLTVRDANDLIAERRILHIAGDETALRQLGRGSWIGGTIPYFLTSEGGVVERERVFVTELPAVVKNVTTQFIDIGHIPAITTDAPHNGFSIVIVPGLTDIHTTYGLTANSIPGIHDAAVVGWISGVHLDDVGKLTPKVFDGVTGEVSDNRIVVMRATIPSAKVAIVGIVNVFEPGAGDAVVFSESNFFAGPCSINGVLEDFYDYTMRKGLDLTLPLITELSGNLINVSFQKIDHAERRVHFYAPVMKGRTYHQAAPMPDYRKALIEAAKRLHLDPAFACNCILNYVHGKLEGDQFIPLPGPATFGELAHILVNQTLVYLVIKDK
jgi:hypothetical protein